MTARAWYRTASGVMVDLADVRPENIVLEDIAHHLARLCRFNGSTRRTYSVAQHSAYVARNIGGTPALRRAALLHDAAEAYTGDMTTGLKRLLPDYKPIVARIEEAIAVHFQLAVPFSHPAIKDADLRARLSEARDIFDDYPREQLLGGEGEREPYAERCDDTLTFDEAEHAFLRAAWELNLE